MRDIKKSEEKIQRAWKRDDVFKKSVKQREGQPRFVFYDGPPTANGRPGIHHAMILSMKDAFLRFKTMRGFLVERRAGWDTHGLPVEIEVEKELGFKGKADIEKYGIAKFNAKAKKSVWRYKKEWEQLQDRLGFWIDHDHPYITYENTYIESVWWALKQAHDKGLLEEDYKVVPYCPRCGTALASHEVAQGYQTVHDRSLTVAFRVKGEENVAILAWTTTPWTLPGNVALAVGNDITYAEVYVADENMTYILAKELVEKTMGERAYEVRGELPGEKLVGLTYEPLFTISETKNEKSHKVYAADFVTTDEGTGVVHTAVMYGEDDYRLGETAGLPKVHTVLEDGTFTEFVPDGLKGMFVKDEKTEKRIVDALKKRGMLFQEERHEHEYPFCWRCKTPLLYYARTSWYIRMSQLRDELLEENDRINWVPKHLRDGRFGEWLREVKDWAISRERYWGTPLPIWRCEKEKSHIEVLGSIEELARRIGFKNRYLLVRHGESENNVQHVLSSEPETEYPLTDVGRKQVGQAAKTLKKEKVDMLLTSDLMRAHQTAAIIGKALKIEPKTDTRLREIHLGVFEGKTLEEYQAHFEIDTLTAFTKRPKGGEDWDDVRSRIGGLIEELERKHEGKTIVLVSHAGPIVLLEMLTRGLWDNAYFDGTIAELDNAEVEELQGGMLPQDMDGLLDVHRPWVDEIAFDCPKGDGVMRRVPEVADVWLDSAAMPFAQWHYPFENKELVDEQWYPADFILEAIDQTRGWFYTLLATAVFLGRERPYRNVVSTGHVLDKKGKKMSKSRGNTVAPWEMIEKYGADAVRWYFYTVNQPSDSKRFDEKDVKTVMNRMIGTFINIHTFFTTYAQRGAYKKLQGDTPTATTVIDRWILSRYHHALAQVAKQMDTYELMEATRTLEHFVIEDLSNWYVRRSRQRFQHPVSRDDYRAVSQLLAYVLAGTAKALAPFIPFAAEEVYQGVVKSGSVHLAGYPEPSAPMQDENLEEEMRLVQALVAEGLAIRKGEKIPVRQPLAALAIGQEYGGLLKNQELKQLVMDELNVKDVVSIDIGLHEDWLRLPKAPDTAPRLDLEITPELKIEGDVRELTRTVQEMRKEAGLEPADLITLCVVGSGASTTAFVEAVKADPGILRVEKLQETRGRGKFLAEREPNIENNEIWLGIRA